MQALKTLKQAKQVCPLTAGPTDMHGPLIVHPHLTQSTIFTAVLCNGYL